MVFPSINKLVGTGFSRMPIWVKPCISMLLVLSAMQLFPQIYVGDTMHESQTWTNEHTYVIYKDLIVPDGIHLTIEEGVVVKINYGWGIIVDKGVLRVNGTQSDSVSFVPNRSHPSQVWKWKGIVIKNADAENVSYLGYAHIADAETAIEMENCWDVIIENSSMLNCQNLGVHIVNSSSCYLIDCNIESNYDGVELFAGYLGSTSNNIIYNCIVKNQNHNIVIFGEEGGINQNNLITGNLIGSGNNGIWIENSGGLVNSGNIIKQNLILNNGAGAGFGLFLGHDSTIVANNIFCGNTIAVFSEDKGDNCSIINNSFYQNNWAIAIGPGSESNQYLNNTFSLNSTELLGIKETHDVVFSNNNMLHNNGLENIVVNYVHFDLSVAGNYWGTTDTSRINKLIYDRSDDPALGELDYVPYLNSIDTSNPVSPPYQVIKQAVGSNVQISWHENQEQDLMGYRVYCGNYANYAFSENHEAGIDTAFVLSGDVSVFDPIAVTAFDSAVIAANTQLSGHESPFAFAVAYPYAGNDTLICNNQEGLKIVNSNVPFEHQNIFWTTSGDGFFNDPCILVPTYFPGYMDVQDGEALISLKAIIEEDTLVDSFNLLIKDNPVAFAGNDTIVVADSEIALVGAVAHNFDSVMWFSGGDGSFNSNTLVNPVYLPGSSDIESGVVYLEMMAYSVCGIAADSIKIIIEPYFSVEGKLWASQKTADPGVVIAFKESDEGARAVQIENAETDGTFRFHKLTVGNYYLYALPDTNNPDDAVPGYYANKLRWQSAYLLPVDADVYDVDIYLPSLDFALPAGEASISGHMLMPQSSKYNGDVYCMPWFDCNSNVFCNGGLSNVTVLLFNHAKAKLLDYTLTDELGNFYFNRLPYGSYVVDAEKAGFSTIASPIITLSPEHKNESGVILEIDQKKLKISFDGDASMENSTAVFPNPAYNEINIPCPEPLSLQMEIYDLFGNRVLKQSVLPGKAPSIFKLDISPLPPGLYFGQIVNSNQITVHFRFVKK